MPGLSYPFAYECSGCARSTTVRRADARELSPNPDRLDAPDTVLWKRGWVRDDLDGPLFCPDCAPEAA